MHYRLYCTIVALVPMMPTDAHARPPFHGWRIVVAASGLQLLVATLMMHSFGAYVAVLPDSEGWSKTALSGVAAMQQVEATLLGPLQGWIADRHGARTMVRAGVVSFALGLLLLPLATTLAAFYGFYLLIAPGVGLAGYFSLSIVVNWFERLRTRAMSLVMLGMVAGGFLAPLVAWSLQTYGWRVTAFCSGVLALVIGWPLAGMLHHRPEDLGQHVDGMAPAALAPAPTAAATEPPPVVRDATVREALRSRIYWLLGLGHASSLLAVSTISMHAVTHIKEGLGYSLTQAASMLTAQSFAYAAGVLASGVLGDRWGKARLSAGCLLQHAVA